jgi:transposase
MSARIEVVGRVSGRRRWTPAQKLAMLRDAFGPEGSVRSACERHGIGSGLLYIWRRQAMAGELTGANPQALPMFAEVELSPRPVLASEGPRLPEPSGTIGIELLCGVKLTVDAAVDADALGRVIAVLNR